MRTWKLVRVALAVFLLAALSANPVAAAVNDTSETAIVVSSANPSETGTLVGSKGGAYRLYRFAYPGGDAPVVIHLTWNPGWGSTDAAFGFNVYGPRGLVGRGARGDDAGQASTANFTLQSLTPGDYLVQIFSYTDGTYQAYTIDFSGLGPPPATAQGNTSDSTELAVRQEASSFSGSLVGHSAGAFNYYSVEYPGAGWPLTISLSYSPTSYLDRENFGFKVWDGETLIAWGDESNRTPEIALQTATIKRTQPGMLTLQVYNYEEGIAGEYAVGIRGAVSTVANVVDNGTPDRALHLTPQLMAGHGQLVGNGGGSFSYFNFDYRGEDKPVTLSLAFKPGLGITGKGVGFNVYRGTERVAMGGLAEGRNSGEGVAYVTYKSDAAHLVVQVYNYIPGVPIEYTFYCLGLE